MEFAPLPFVEVAVGHFAPGANTPPIPLATCSRLFLHSAAEKISTGHYSHGSAFHLHELSLTVHFHFTWHKSHFWNYEWNESDVQCKFSTHFHIICKWIPPHPTPREQITQK